MQAEELWPGATLALWRAVADSLKLNANDDELQRSFLRYLNFVASNVRTLEDFQSKRAKPRQILAPVINAQITARKLRLQLQALPVELFAPNADERFTIRLEDSLLDLDWLLDDLLTLDELSDKAREILKARRQPDPRAQRNDVLGSTIERAYRDLTGKESTCYTNPASDAGYDSAARTIGTFPPFLRLIAQRVGISEAEAAAIIEFRRTRHRSRYASVRAAVKRD